MQTIPIFTSFVEQTQTLRNMKNNILIFILFTLFSIDANGAVYRVNNTGADADYTTAQEAHDAASSGDSLYIEASPTDYGALTISKKIHIFGTGYFLGENLNLQANVSTSKVTSISLAAGCNESTIQGMTITLTIAVSGNAAFSDVIIQRNYIEGGIKLTTTGLVEDMFIIDNFINGSNFSYNSLVTAGASNKNLIVTNNIFAYGSIYSYITFHSQTSAVFTNNIFANQSISTTNSDFQNNVLVSPSVANLPLNTFSYNICTGTQFPSGSNNQQNVNNASIFVGYPTQGSYTSDNRYELLPGSPAEGTGNGGVDCGVFGGTQPYILSGIPPIPTIYKFESPNVVTGNFNITVSTRSNN